jgi:hypothetical protein
MKKSYFPLVFAILLGLTTQHALCMEKELETSTTLIAKLEKLEKEHKREGEKNMQILKKYPVLFKDDSIRTPIPGRHNDLIISNDRLSEIAYEKVVILGLEVLVLQSKT